MWAVAHGCDPTLADDFAQYCALHWISGKRIHARHLWLYLDFRKSLKHQSHPTIQLSESHESCHPAPKIPAIKFTNDLSQSERVALVLKVSWGFTLAEIAQCLGVSESRVSKIIKGLINKSTREGLHHGRKRE